MRLTGIIHREGESTHVQRNNTRMLRLRIADELVDTPATVQLVVGVLHQDTDQLWSIVIAPTGEIGMTYGRIGNTDVEHSVLGRFHSDGTLEIHEPRSTDSHPSRGGTPT